MMYALLTLQWILVLICAPLTIGMVRTMKARFQNRRGASIFLPYIQLASLLRKGMTITIHSSWVFRVVPFVVLGSAACIAFLAPSVSFGVIPDSLDNIFLFGAIMALGSVFLVLGGMDTGSTFPNMGSSREMTLMALVEPALYVTLATLALVANSWSLGGIVAHFALNSWVSVVPAASVTLAALLLVILAENARYPVDNPATHLELTMVHEAMVLEYSGPYLAMLEYASALKLTVLLALLLGLVFPFGIIHAPYTLPAIVFGLLAFVVKLVLGAFLIACIESMVVKMRFYRMQEYMSVAFLLACAGLLIELTYVSYR